VTGELPPEERVEWQRSKEALGDHAAVERLLVEACARLRHRQLVRVWKICRQPFAADALQGIGGLYTSGRWHHKGIPIVYTAGSPALAALEVLVPVDPLCAPADLRLLAIDLPPDLSMEVIGRSEGWRKQRQGNQIVS
jgi:RES domain-containing protein